MSYYITSDQHFFHVNALTLMSHRPWKTIEEMNEGLINNHNTVVKPEDICIHLGDLVMGKKQDTVPRIIPKLNGIHYLVVGNHDFLPSETRANKLQQMETLYLSNGIKQIIYGCASLSMITNNPLHDKIKVCHFPILSIPDHPDQYEQRYKELHPILTEGEYLLCGHTHNRSHLLHDNVYHVGVDAAIHNYSPVLLDEVLERLQIKF